MMIVLTILFIFMNLIDLGFGYEKFQVMMSKQRFSAMIAVYIDEVNGKKCKPRIGGPDDSCQVYCQTYYQYAQSSQYKNLMHFNKQTGYCQSKLLCPPFLGVYYDEKLNKCIDQIQGKYVQPIIKSQPKADLTLNVTVICLHGKKIIYNGYPECQCELGYKTYIKFRVQYKNESIVTMSKCNQPAKLYQYLPKYLEIYYDPYLDNKFPFAADDLYWIKAFIYYIKQLKYQITTFFVPWQVEIMTLTLKQQPTVRNSDLIKLYWILSMIVIIVILSIYQKCSHTKTVHQMIIQNNNVNQN